MGMTNLSILSRFFNERINAVDGQTRPVLQRLKSVCERRANGSISEDKALFELDKILGRNLSPVIPSFIFGSTKSKPMNLFAGTKTNYKTSPLFNVQDFGLKNKREQFPVLGLKPLYNNSNKQRFIVSPMSSTWFDIKDFKQSTPVIGNFGGTKINSGKSVLSGLNFDKQPRSASSEFKSEVFTHRMNESNRAMKAMIQNTKSNMKNQPVFNFGAAKGKSQKFPSLAEMMGGKNGL